MVKREQADSGLRAGFIREEDAKKQLAQQAMSAVEETVPEQEAKPSDPPEKTEARVPAQEKEAEPEGPTISVQGISGRMISGTIRVVKKAERKKEDSKEEPKAEAAPDQTVVKAEAPLASEVKEERKQAEAPAPKAEPAAGKAVAAEEGGKAETTVRTPAAKTAPAPEENKAEKPVQAAPAAEKTKDEPGVKEQAVPAAAAKTERKAAAITDLPHKAPAGPRTETPRETQPRPAAQTSDEVKRPDRPLSYQERTGKAPIRAQKGSYVGKDANTPAFRERSSAGFRREGAPSRDSRGGSRQGSFGGRERSSQGRFGASPKQGGDPRFGSGGFNRDKDKDADDTPRRTRSPKPQKSAGRGTADAPMLGADKKSEFRRNYAAHREGKGRDRAAEDFRNDEERMLDERVVRRGRKEQSAPAQRAQLTQVKLPASLTVKELSEILKKTSAEVIMKLMGYGVMATVNQEIDYDTAEVIAGEFGIKCEQIIEVTEEEILFDESDDREEDLVKRPPVVVVMGHVDHGKTSILDWIRKARVASGEAGGITQHIGAYTAIVNGENITFLDTPGHEAFTAMRARGAKVTDIAILVVAADDGVMPQTIEAIHHAKAAGTEIIVAINKIDRPTANLDRVKQELAQQGLLSPDWGGTTEMVPVSAKTGENMQELLEMILLTAEMLDLKANPDRQAKGTVVEGSMDKNRGAVATVLVQRGTLRLGDQVVVGSMIGNIRAMSDHTGRPVKQAGPSMPVEILGLPDVPADGDTFYVVENEKVAKSLIERRQEEERERLLKKTSKVSLENLFEKMSEGETKDLNIIIKADVMGSVEALTQSLEKLSGDEVKLNVIHGAVGAITETDVRLADVSEAIIIGFNVRPAANVAEMAKEENVDIRLYRVIYDAIEDIEKAMKGMLAPTFVEEVLGHAEVRETYKVTGVGTIAGCYVTDGKIQRNASVRIVRDGIVVHEGTLASLKRFKDDVREVAQGYECGMNISDYNDIKIGDQFEMYRMKEVERE